MELEERSLIRVDSLNDRVTYEQNPHARKGKVKTRTLENHEDAAPKFVSALNLSATRPPAQILLSSFKGAPPARYFELWIVRKLLARSTRKLEELGL